MTNRDSSDGGIHIQSGIGLTPDQINPSRMHVDCRVNGRLSSLASGFPATIPESHWLVLMWSYLALFNHLSFLMTQSPDLVCFPDFFRAFSFSPSALLAALPLLGWRVRGCVAFISLQVAWATFSSFHPASPWASHPLLYFSDHPQLIVNLIPSPDLWILDLSFQWPTRSFHLDKP